MSEVRNMAKFTGKTGKNNKPSSSGILRERRVRSLQLVEVRGVEPLSESHSIWAATCLARLLISPSCARTDPLTKRPVPESYREIGTPFPTSTLIAQMQRSALHIRVAALLGSHCVRIIFGNYDFHRMINEANRCSSTCCSVSPVSRRKPVHPRILMWILNYKL